MLRALTANSPVAFALLDRQHQVLRSGELALSELAGSVPASRVEAVLHPADSILTTVIVPPLPTHRLGAAVAGAVEPLLLGDIDLLAIAHGPRAADGTVAVAWGPRAELAAALQLLTTVGLPADAMLAAPLVLPLAHGGWTALIRDGLIVVRTGAQSGYCWAIDPLAPDDGTEPALATFQLAVEQDVPPAITWIEPQPTHWKSTVGVASHSLPSAARWRGIAPDWSLALPALRPRHRAGSRWKRPLAWTAAAAAVWVLGLNLHAWQLGREERALRQRMNEQVKAAFPGIPVIVDPLRQAEQGRDALRAADGKFGDSDFLPLALATAKLLPQAASNLTTLTFAEGELRLRLVDDGIGMKPLATPAPASPAARARRFGLPRSQAQAPAAPNLPVRVEIDPAIKQQAQALGLRVDRVDDEWRIRPAGSDDTNTSAGSTGLRIQSGGPSR